MDHGILQRQEIPTHLEVEDRLLFGLTLRQGMIVLVGLSVGYFLYAQLGALTWPLSRFPGGAHPPLAVRICVALLPALCSLALAVVQPAGRPLEEWLFALVRYATLPKRYVWRPRTSLSISLISVEHPGAGEVAGLEFHAEAVAVREAMGMLRHVLDADVTMWTAAPDRHLPRNR